MSSATANEPFVFTPGSAPVAATGTDPLVNETRREIAEIVREVAQAVRSDRTEDEFLGLLVDRILRAMAAEGVLVWRRGDAGGRPCRCLRRLGRVTDQSIPTESIATHDRMLAEVAVDGQPVVVPATPGATDGDVPANPMDVPVAVAPIECESSVEGATFLLEVFLEPGCGVATQRGYLRFVAQMADLAGEFLRADQLRRLRGGQTLARQVDAAIIELHRMDDRKKLQAVVVDRAAAIFGFDRVGLCLRGPKATLEAVSHVNTIDTTSPAAQQICNAASVDLDDDGCAWLEDSVADVAHEEPIRLQAVVGSESSVSRSLVCMQSSDTEPVSQECRGELIRYMQHAELALKSVAQLEAIPGGRILASLAPAIQRRRGARKPIAVAAALFVLLIAAVLFPVPLVVYSSASVRPAIVETLTAPRDAAVDQIHVQHGQAVFRGEKLLSLVDPVLEEQITGLVGRRAVLVQQQSHWRDALVDIAVTQMDRLEQVQGEQSLVREEIRSIDEQLAVLQRVLDSLVVRAGRDGIVDAWQIEQRLQSRPLRRGDLLMQVVAKDSPWMVDARVPQSRISHVQDAHAAQDLSARVSLEADTNQSFDASLEQIGPAVSADHDEVPATAVLLRLTDRASTMIASRQGTSHQSGAPARVMFHCGKTPAAYLLFQDVIRSLRGAWALYARTDGAGEAGNSGEVS